MNSLASGTISGGANAEKKALLAGCLNLDLLHLSPRCRLSGKEACGPLRPGSRRHWRRFHAHCTAKATLELFVVTERTRLGLRLGLIATAAADPVPDVHRFALADSAFLERDSSSIACWPAHHLHLVERIRRDLLVECALGSQTVVPLARAAARRVSFAEARPSCLAR